MTAQTFPLISIIIPTYNEADDIRGTLEAIIRLDYPRKEVIVVDDSNDRTPEIVKEFSVYGVRILRQAGQDGRSGARNQGILEAVGDVCVVLNADVLLPRDFLTRIAQHYLQGADYVLVEGRVANMENVYARYTDAEGQFAYGATDQIQWTEGFSARRDALLKVGMFPTGFAVPVVAGEDGFLGQKLHDHHYCKVIDRSIVVTHIAPASFSAYWKQQVGRGEGFAQTRILLGGANPTLVAFRTAVKTAFTFIRIVSLFIMWRAWQIAKCSSHGHRDFLPFTLVRLIQLCAQMYGEWIAQWEIARASRWKVHISQ